MALPTLDATFASSADLPRRQMLAKWLVEELGETQAPSNVLVSGAGSSAANGTYTYRGDNEGKGYYNLVGEADSTTENAIVYSDDIWKILDSNTDQFYIGSDTEFPWTASWSENAGDIPAPTVTESPSPSPISNYYSLPERYLWAKIAVAAGGPKTEADYISLPKNYAWSDIYNAVSGDIANSTVVVSGLSDSQLNGNYVYDGDVNERPSYRLNANTTIAWDNNISKWQINYSGDLSESSSNVTYPWLATGWSNEGIDPTGIVLIPQTPNHTDWSENVVLGHIAAAYRGDTANPANLATYIDWPWRYKIASIIGGVTVPFSPNDISGLQLWLDGSDTSTMYDAISGGSLVAIDGAIARWEDKSVNNNHAIQSVSNNRPLRKASQLNSLNGVEFDGTNDGLEGSEVLTDYPYSVFSVCKFTSDTDIGLIFGQRNIEFLPTIYKFGENNIRLYSGQNLQASDSVNNNSWYSLRFIGNEENSKIYINNVLVVSGDAGSGAMSGNYILGFSPDYFGGRWQGIVYAELLVYNRVLTSEETSEIESYINTKWGI